MKKVHPDTVLADLKQQSKSPRTWRNLEIIHQVCQSASAGNKDYSPASIGRASQHLRGPSLNTLYSPLGARFRTLITAWAQWEGVGEKKPPGDLPALKDDAEILARIEDPVVRSLAGIRLAELRRLRNEVNTLKASANVSIDLRPKGPTGPGGVLQAGPAILDSEREALESVVDPKWMERHGWRPGTRGEVIDAAGKAILPVGTLTGIRKLLGSQSRNPRADH